MSILGYVSIGLCKTGSFISIVTFGTDEFTCDDGNCVRANMKCDGILQCEDGSDEKGCIGVLIAAF